MIVEQIRHSHCENTTVIDIVTVIVKIVFSTIIILRIKIIIRHIPITFIKEIIISGMIIIMFL